MCSWVAKSARRKVRPKRSSTHSRCIIPRSVVCAKSHTSSRSIKKSKVGTARRQCKQSANFGLTFTGRFLERYYSARLYRTGTAVPLTEGKLGSRLCLHVVPRSLDESERESRVG